MESSLVISLGVIAILLVLSAFFSGSETALTAASRPLIHELERKGNRRAGLVNMLRQDKERLIGAILLGNNLVNILASVLATSILIGLFGEAGVIYATVAMTLLVVIFAEVLPKTYAIQNATRMSLAVAPLVRRVVIVLSPVVVILQMFVRIVLRLFGIDISADQGMTMTAEELHGAIALHTGEGPGIGHERAMLHSILELADVEVGEIMVHRKAGDGGGVLVRQPPVEPPIEVAYGERAFDNGGAIALYLYTGRGDVVFVGNVADDFLENILEGDDPHQRPVFIDHQGEMLPPLTEGLELV